jgi:hypothetical protein
VRKLFCTSSRRPAMRAARAAGQGPDLQVHRSGTLPLRSRHPAVLAPPAARRQIPRSPGPPQPAARGRRKNMNGRPSAGLTRREKPPAGASGSRMEERPSRPPTTQAEPSRAGPGRQGRSSGGALHLGALALARSPAGGSTADGMTKETGCGPSYAPGQRACEIIPISSRCLAESSRDLIGFENHDAPLPSLHA